MVEEAAAMVEEATEVDLAAAGSVVSKAHRRSKSAWSRSTLPPTGSGDAPRDGTMCRID